MLFIVILLLIYWLSIRDTVELKTTCQDLTHQIILAGDAPKELSSLTLRLDELSGMTGKSITNEGSDPLLNFISTSTFSTNKLINYLPLHSYQNQRYLVETRTAVFEGTFRSLVEFLFDLEKRYVSGKVVSVKFETETNAKTEKKRLLMTLYIQSITSEKEAPSNHTTTNS